MDLHTLQQEIIQEEGGIILKPYKDHLGYWTTGAGHLIRDNEKDELMQPITYQRGLELFLKDQEDKEEFCPNLKWEQPDISVYKETLESQLPEECKK